LPRGLHWGTDRTAWAAAAHRRPDTTAAYPIASRRSGYDRHIITLGDLSALMSLSPYHFQRQFKAQYHVTPHQMLMAFRLYQARQLLIDGMPSAEVAAAVGLTDQAHLTRSFAARYGITPARYQKQVRQSG
ncbi:helix-turn-helix transcriptional regulator, partial [Streptomyces griseofuscus]|uniref:helix-turn-helix transcriptional regulator n=1 Tax=Streptomyces griseofuscus TaxID=146922 RepID=UPI0011CEEBF8